MNDILTALRGALLLEPKVFGDAPQVFLRSSSQRALTEATGVAKPFVQDHHSRCLRGVLRSQHRCGHRPRGERVREVRSAVGDMAVDHAMVLKDSQLAIAWPLGGLTLTASAKGASAARLTDAEVFG